MNDVFKNSLKYTDNKSSGTFTRVYIAEIKSQTEKIGYPAERQAEIDLCASQKVKNEKFSAWKLLSYAVRDIYNKNLNDFVFTKLQTGKWCADKFFFSLSHTKNLVCVAVSDKAIGVDAENLSDFEKKVKEKKDDFWKKIATKKEYESIKNPSIGRLTALWTKKESIYKCFQDKTPFIPGKIETSDYGVFTKKLKIFQEDYVLSVCTPDECLFSIVEE